MVAVRPQDVAAALRRPDPRVIVFLFYGPDAGLVSERAKALAEQSVEDSSDPFQLVRIDADVLAGDPGRLVDEAGTIGLFGGRRVIWIKGSGRTIAPSVQALIESAPQDAIVVIEGGDLARSAPLRTLCERSPRALALPCYSDDGRNLEEVVVETLREGGFSLSRDARAALVAQLGGDRLATRGELAKLMLYAHGQTEITVEDVDAVMSDTSSLVTDMVVDAAFCGDAGVLETGLRRLAAEGSAPAVYLGSALRHGIGLLGASGDVKRGRSVDSIVETWRGLHFKRKAAAKRQLQRWSPGELKSAVALLQDSVLQTRRQSDLGHVIAGRVLLDIARVAQRPRGTRR
jgi:DNA polymerase III subunit delta